MMRLIYNIFLYLALPFIFLILLFPRKGKKSYGTRIGELFGFYHFINNPNTSGVIWFHTVSVGETIAASRLIREFHKAQPDLQIVVTTTTTTGMEQAEKIGDFVTHLFAPLDFPHAIALFVRKVRPVALVIMETELWPNWLKCCHRHHIPTVLINARMSERSCDRYARGNLFYKFFGQYLSLILCQNEEDTQRFKKLGAGKILVTGSLKCDLSAPSDQVSSGKEIRDFFNHRKTWIAASTHEGEDEIFLDVHSRLLASFPELLLILVPRHPQRFSSVAGKIRTAGLSLSRISQQDEFDGSSQVLLGDKMGVMYQLFAASDVAVMGGSFADIGGHNPLEPAAVGIPVIMGSHYYNFKEFTLKMKEKGGLFLVESKEELEEKLRNLLTDDNLRISCGRKAGDVLKTGKGATHRTLQGILTIINGSSR